MPSCYLSKSMSLGRACEVLYEHKSAIAGEGLQAEKRGGGVVRGVGPEMRSSGPVMRRDSWKAGDTWSKVVVFYHWNFQSGKLFSVIILLYQVRLIMTIGSSSVIVSLQDCLFWCAHIVFAVLSVPSAGEAWVPTGRGLCSLMAHSLLRQWGLRNNLAF